MIMIAVGTTMIVVVVDAMIVVVVRSPRSVGRVEA